MCSQDRRRRPASAFERLANANLSYFLGLDADCDGTKPNAILCGDRTLTTNHVILSGLVNFPDSKAIRWARGIHEEGGNLAWADGSVDQIGQLDLRKALQDRNSLPTRLNLP